MVVGVFAIDICGFVLVRDPADDFRRDLHVLLGEGAEEMMPYKQIEVKGLFVEAPLCPCPWCKKTPDLWMPMDRPGSVYMNGRPHVEEDTWVWKIRCCQNSEAKVSIRKTSKHNLSRFLDKIDELFDRWNSNNPVKAYEKKVIDLRMIPNLEMKKC